MKTWFNKNYNLPVCKYRGGKRDIKYPALVSLKLDGELTYIIKKQDRVFCVNKSKYGRYRKDFPALRDFEKWNVPDGVYLGELYWNEGKTKQDFYGLLRNKTSDDLKIAIWGILQMGNESYFTAEKVYSFLSWYKDKSTSNLSVAPMGWVLSEGELKDWMRYIDEGWEGLVIYREDAIWRDGQTNKIIKIKKRQREIETKNKNGKAENLKLNKYGVWI